MRIQHHSGAGFGLMVGNSLRQFIVRQRLNALIQREHHIAPVYRIAVARRIQLIDIIAFIVTQHHTCAVLAAQVVFAGKLQTFLAFAVDIGEADNVGEQIAHRILPFGLGLEGQALNFQSAHFGSGFRAHLPFQEHKIAVGARQAVGNGFHRHFDNFGKLLQLLLAGHFFHGRRNGIQRIGGRAQSQHRAVTVGNRAAVGLLHQSAHKTLITLGLQTVLLHRMQMYAPACRCGKGRGKNQQNKGNPAIGAHRLLLFNWLLPHLRLVIAFNQHGIYSLRCRPHGSKTALF